MEEGCANALECRTRMEIRSTIGFPIDSSRLLPYHRVGAATVVRLSRSAERKLESALVRSFLLAGPLEFTDCNIRMWSIMPCRLCTSGTRLLRYVDGDGKTAHRRYSKHQQDSYCSAWTPAKQYERSSTYSWSARQATTTLFSWIVPDRFAS